MVCDSNILIYAADAQDTRCVEIIDHEDAGLATLSKIEVLGFPGFHALTESTRNRLLLVVNGMRELAMDDRVVAYAIELRQQKKMSLGDAVIAGTALAYGMPLVTRNINDFKHIAGLELINPFDP